MPGRRTRPLARTLALTILMSAAACSLSVRRAGVRHEVEFGTLSGRAGRVVHAKILHDGRPLHPNVRALTVLPGESVRLTSADTPPLSGTSPSSRISAAFEIRVHARDTTPFAWNTDGGTFTVDECEPATGARWVAPRAPGTYRLRHGDAEFSLLVLTPFAKKKGQALSGYVIGDYPNEHAETEQAHAAAPVPGFVAVTPDNQDLAVSAHFRLRDFVCKQQPDHFPKYLVLDVRLLDKLERLVDRLAIDGRPPPRVTIMSGYRTPDYNHTIGNLTTASRHTLGDAADVFVDDDGDGVMDDLDGDGIITLADAGALLRVVDGLDRDPRLAGGAAAYDATDFHGPFVHLDVRGTRTRW